jgi:ATP-binding cassette subfamily B protein/subfamily B ATP-binding cassette protein MsbA
MFIGLALLQGATSFSDYYLTMWVGERFVLGLRSRIFKHVHRLAPDFLERRALGDVLARITSDVDVIEQLLLGQVTQAISYVLEILFFSTALFVLDWRLAAASLVGAPGVLLIAQAFSRRIHRAAREKSRRQGRSKIVI